MDYNKILQSKKFKMILGGIGAIIVLLFVFAAGTIVGFKKANFSFRWAENYHRNFGGPRGGFFEDLGGRDFIDAHGVFGQIIKIDNSTSTPSLVIRGRDNVEKIVLIKDNTVINGFRNNAKSADLKVDDEIVVIGDPNDAGQIEAKLIRIMPASPELQRGEPAMPMIKR